MRADRLLALLLLLQSRGRITASELATELEVSARTIFRDLVALSTAGVPVYCERGPGGGVALVEEYRTTLTGLTPDEARALFALSVLAPLDQLGMGQSLKSAFLKLSAALPYSRRSDELHIRQRIHIDSTGWHETQPTIPCLGTIQQALWQDNLLHIQYRSLQNAVIEQVVAPYGLVAKVNLWHLIYGWQGSMRVLRVSAITQAEMLAETFSRPVDFHLAAFWESWCAANEAQPAYIARVRVSPELLPNLSYFLDERFRHLRTTDRCTDPDGWTSLDLPFESFHSARTRLLGLGRAVEVLEPEPLRKSILDFAAQIIDLYYGK